MDFEPSAITLVVMERELQKSLRIAIETVRFRSPTHFHFSQPLFFAVGENLPIDGVGKLI